MNCKDFLNNIGDYVNQTCDPGATSEFDSHVGKCASCAMEYRQLKATAQLVQSLDKKVTPIGFEARLKARIAARQESAQPERLTFLQRVVGLILGPPAHGHRTALRPVLAGFLLCMILGGSFMVNRHNASLPSGMDWAYVQTIRQQQDSFAVSNPLSDESAVMLNEHNQLASSEF
jgi:anti-sigma factor RsiW